MKENILSSCIINPAWPPLSFPLWAPGTSFLDCMVPREGAGRGPGQGPGLALSAEPRTTQGNIGLTALLPLPFLLCKPPPSLRLSVPLAALFPPHLCPSLVA